MRKNSTPHKPPSCYACRRTPKHVDSTLRYRLALASRTHSTLHAFVHNFISLLWGGCRNAEILDSFVKTKIIHVPFLKNQTGSRPWHRTHLRRDARGGYCAKIPRDRLLHRQKRFGAYQFREGGKSLVPGNSGQISFQLRSDHELERFEFREIVALPGRAVPRHAPGRSRATGGVREIHGTRRRVDGFSFFRVRTDAFRLSAELGLVSRLVSWLRPIREQHVAAHVGGSPCRRHESPRDKRSARDLHIRACL